jgi:uncharacterized protein (DUF1810 family)
MPAVDLDRFRDAYRRDFDHALSELDGGLKRTHWMWFIFPQITGLGSSPTAVHYAIRSRAEAEVFLADPDLGPGYRRLIDVVWRQVVTGGVTIRRLFGQPDDRKLVSSLTLFAGVATDLDETWASFLAQVGEILDHAAAQGLPRRCPDTERFLVDADA